MPIQNLHEDMYVCVGGGDCVVRCKSSPKEWNEYVVFPYL